MFIRTRGIVTAVAAAAGLLAVTQAQAVTLVGLNNAPTGGQTIFSVDSSNASVITGQTAITDLGAGVSIQGIDYRPADGLLYAVGSNDALYTINTVTGAASVVGSGFSSESLSGTSFGFDFNPTIDRIRNVSDADQNLVINPITGDVQLTATPVAYAAGDSNDGVDPNVVHHAYTNNFDGSVSTQLYAIDTNLDILVTQANNAGVLGTVGSLGVDATDMGGFDIAADGSVFAAFSDDLGLSATFYSIDLGTGAASSLGLLGQNVAGLTAAPTDLVVGVAVAPIPEPATATMGLMALAALAAARSRRR